MKIINFAGAFLKYNNDVLLMHRGLHKKIAPGMWAGIGGHVEPSEINDPAAACLREIEEESGVLPSDIQDLSLRYIVVNNAESGIEIIYFFTGELKSQCLLAETDEGTLHWVDINEARKLPMSLPVRQIYSHWADSPESERIMLCSITQNNCVQWSAL